MPESAKFNEFLRTTGFSLVELGLEDIALSRADTLSALAILRDDGIPVLGGDVFLRRGPKVEIGYANWHSDRRDGETAEEYVDRSIRESWEYVSSFPHLSHTEPIFVLVVPRPS